MKNLNENEKKVLDNLLKGILKNKSCYTLEGLSKETGYAKSDIHKAFARLKTINGWSIIPVNSTPYERHVMNNVTDKQGYRMYPIHNRGRNKGDRNEHDRNEPFWERTYYKVSRPDEDL